MKRIKRRVFNILLLFLVINIPISYGQSNLKQLIKKYPVPDEAIELELKYSFPKEDLEYKNIFFWDTKNMNIDDEGKIYVADSRHNEIFCFDSDGKYLFQFGRKGQGPGEFIRPYYINFYENIIIIYDNGNRRFQFFDKQGKYLKSFKSFKTYVDIFVNKEGQIFAAPLPNPANDYLIDVLSEDGHLLYSFGDPPNKKDSFLNFPILNGNYDKEIYVAFRFLPIVRKYSTEGKLIKEIIIDHKLVKDYTNSNLKANSKRKAGMPTRYKCTVLSMRFYDFNIFLLLGNYDPLSYSRKELLRYDSNLDRKNHYWYLVNEPQLTPDFVVAKDEMSYIFYVLQKTPKNRIEVFGRK